MFICLRCETWLTGALRSVPMSFPQFDDFSRELCVQALLDIMDMFCDRLR